MLMTPQALVLAAGKGTRMKSAQAKVLHRLLGMPLLEGVLRAVEQVGASPITVVVGHEAEAVEAAFAGRAQFVRQEPPRGTGHAVQVARGAIARERERPLLVVNGDLPLLEADTLGALLAEHNRSRAAASLLSARLEEAGAYGRVLREAGGRVRAIVEAKDASPEELALREINAGVYVFSVGPLLEVLDRLSAKNSQGELYLTDTIGLLAEAGHVVSALPCAEPTQALGVNTLGELADLARRLRDRRAAALMAAGVTIEDPASTFVGLDAVVEPDAVLRPFTILEGRTRIGRGAQVGPFARLVDAEIGERAEVLDHCLLRQCRVGAGASIGPFAHIRPESEIAERAKVGNFVELKKTKLGTGSKAPHLSYLGDAVIGAAVNIGAGTITCNYDGKHKHVTRIEEGAFIGSDTTLVAPLTVGQGAYVAAGSAITEDVPKDALALGRSRQVVKAGWAARRREDLANKAKA
jgi:bifunctional UDP-N-acetylglucosamine pyrophosphorylase/glucosamine-1-phosphate N-acetyltransferase